MITWMKLILNGYIYIYIYIWFDMQKLYNHVKGWEEDGKREKGTIFISFVDDDDYHLKVYHVNTFVSLFTSAEFFNRINYLIVHHRIFYVNLHIKNRYWRWRLQSFLIDNIPFTWYQYMIEYSIIIYFMNLNYIILITKFKKRIMKTKLYSIYFQFIVILNSNSIKFNMLWRKQIIL